MEGLVRTRVALYRCTSVDTVSDQVLQSMVCWSRSLPDNADCGSPQACIFPCPDPRGTASWHTDPSFC